MRAQEQKLTHSTLGVMKECPVHPDMRECQPYPGLPDWQQSKFGLQLSTQ